MTKFIFEVIIAAVLIGVCSTPEKEVVELSATSEPVYIYEPYEDPDEWHTEPHMIPYIMDESEVALIAQLAYGEANNQSEYGKRLVIDAVLNRVRSSKFPNTVRGVIFQSGQFSPATVLERYPVNDDICSLVRQEIMETTNSEVLYFNSIGFIDGTPLFKEGNHYFAK